MLLRSSARVSRWHHQGHARWRRGRLRAYRPCLWAVHAFRAATAGTRAPRFQAAVVSVRFGARWSARARAHDARRSSPASSACIPVPVKRCASAGTSSDVPPPGDDVGSIALQHPLSAHTKPRSVPRERADRSLRARSRAAPRTASEVSTRESLRSRPRSSRCSLHCERQVSATLLGRATARRGSPDAAAPRRRARPR